jgi:hypothetical protein
MADEVHPKVERFARHVAAAVSAVTGAEQTGWEGIRISRELDSEVKDGTLLIGSQDAAVIERRVARSRPVEPATETDPDPTGSALVVRGLVRTVANSAETPLPRPADVPAEAGHRYGDERSWLPLDHSSTIQTRFTQAWLRRSFDRVVQTMQQQGAMTAEVAAQVRAHGEPSADPYADATDRFVEIVAARTRNEPSDLLRRIHVAPPAQKAVVVADAMLAHSVLRRLPPGADYERVRHELAGWVDRRIGGLSDARQLGAAAGERVAGQVFESLKALEGGTAGGVPMRMLGEQAPAHRATAAREAADGRAQPGTGPPGVSQEWDGR